MTLHVASPAVTHRAPSSSTTTSTSTAAATRAAAVAPKRAAKAQQNTSGFDGLVRSAKRLVRNAPAGAALLGLALLGGAAAAPLPNGTTAGFTTALPQTTPTALPAIAVPGASRSTVTW